MRKAISLAAIALLFQNTLAFAVEMPEVERNLVDVFISGCVNNMASVKDIQAFAQSKAGRPLSVSETQPLKILPNSQPKGWSVNQNGVVYLIGFSEGKSGSKNVFNCTLASEQGFQEPTEKLMTAKLNLTKHSDTNSSVRHQVWTYTDQKGQMLIELFTASDSKSPSVTLNATVVIE